ncbi:hypothetical protein [Spirillospora sp. NPDC029432]|uniref:hypothetical protein n=1 Tax=Spirillospora sp. NPDC029432 TaxID=3154599 RepID=UPI003452F6D8
MRGRKVLLAGLVFMATATGVSTATAAQAGAAPGAMGRVTLYGTSGGATVGYTTCDNPAQSRLNGVFTSFTNEPRPGCQVVLLNRTSSMVLCAGRGTIPEAFRQDPGLRIQAGETRPCGIIPTVPSR